jgi:ubiquinone biosynthesis protein COQ4
MMTAVFDNAARRTDLPGRRRRDWGHALRSVQQLLRNKDDTRLVFEVMTALEGTANADGYMRLIGTQQGGRLAYERTEFARRLMDQAWLDTLPEGSVGAAYRAFIRSGDLSADSSAMISQQADAQVDEAHPFAWFSRRARDVHDIWHVLTGYTRDALGEASIVAFSYAQTRGLGLALIAAGAAFRVRNQRQTPYVAALWEGYRNGQAAAWLMGEDYEALMREPLEAARTRLRIRAPQIYLSIPPQDRLILPGD